MTGADKARLLAQAISEVINALALLASPDGSGAFPDDAWQALHDQLLLLQAEHRPGASWTRQPPLDRLLDMLPELVEAVGQAPSSSEHRAEASVLAARFMATLYPDAAKP